VNGHRAKPSCRLEAGDDVRIPPATLRDNSVVTIPSKVLQLIKQSICYEDGDMMVIDKPAGMAVHGGSGLNWGVIDVVRRLRPKGQVDLVHRLDRVTSGCLLVALNGQALRCLHEQLENSLIDKRYLCLMDGLMGQGVIEVRESISKSIRSGERYMQVDPGGKSAHTTFRHLQDYAVCSYVEAQLHTGRTHQIRVHAAHLGLALVGDKRYATVKRHKHWRSRGVRRLFLHAHQLGFKTLDGEERLINCPLPGDLRKFLDSLA